MELRKIREDATSITLGWDPVPGAEGYLFYKDGVRVSRSFDPSRRTVKFSKPGVYRVQAVVFAVIDQDTWPDPLPPVGPKLAPMTHYAAPGADARFCVHWAGVTRLGPDDYQDERGTVYSENGLVKSGPSRSGQFVAVLKPANSMDGMEPCQGYTKDGRTFPPWPPESYEV